MCVCACVSKHTFCSGVTLQQITAEQQEAASKKIRSNFSANTFAFTQQKENTDSISIHKTALSVAHDVNTYETASTNNQRKPLALLGRRVSL